MGVLTLCISLLLLVLSLKGFRTKPLHPVILFYGLWSFILLLSSINAYGIHKPSSQAYLLILIMLVAFFIGNLLSRVRVPGNRTFVKKAKPPRDYLSFFFFYLLLGISFLFIFSDSIAIIRELRNGTPLWQIRNWVYETTGSNNPLLRNRSFVEDVFRTLVLEPFAIIVPPVAAYYFFHPKRYKNRYKLLALTAVRLLFASLSSGGGRLGFIYYVGCFLLAYLAMSDKRMLKAINFRKYTKYIILFSVLGFAVVLGSTAIRTGAGNFVKQTYTYFALPPTLLSVWLSDLNGVSNLFGMMTLFGIHSYFFRVLDVVGAGFLVPESYYRAYQHILNASSFRNVGYGTANSFVTPIYYFYIDGSYFFTIFASLIFGVIVSKVYSKLFNEIGDINKLTVKSFTHYAMMMYGVFLSFMRIQTSIPQYCIAFIMVGFLTRKVRLRVTIAQHERQKM